MIYFIEFFLTEKGSYYCNLSILILHHYIPVSVLQVPSYM